MKVNERYLDLRARMELPWATDEGEKLDQAANIGMWAELAGSAPSVLLTNPRVRWEAIDDRTAALVVPLGEHETDRITVRFDAVSGKIRSLKAPRYRSSTSARKVMWIAAHIGTKTIGPADVPAVGMAMWLDQGKPWAFFTAEDVRTNVDVGEYVRARGV